MKEENSDLLQGQIMFSVSCYSQTQQCTLKITHCYIKEGQVGPDVNTIDRVTLKSIHYFLLTY